MTKFKTIEMIIECPACKGTGIYQGMAEREKAAVVCYKCDGSGAYKYKYQYKDFTGRKTREGVERVYLSAYGYCITTGRVTFSGIGEIDMDKEGISYEDFLSGKRPRHVEKLACPMLADQSACHKIKGFTDHCNKVNGGWVGYIPDCKNKENKSECWKRFYGKKTND